MLTDWTELTKVVDGWQGGVGGSFRFNNASKKFLNKIQPTDIRLSSDCNQPPSTVTMPLGARIKPVQSCFKPDSINYTRLIQMPLYGP